LNNIVASYDNLLGPSIDPRGTNYCGPAVVNSSGNSASISAYGSEQIAGLCVRLEASGLALNRFAMFLNSQTQGLVMPPGSQGNICLGGAIGRYRLDILPTGASGSVALALDLTDTPTPTGPDSIQPGQTWQFQLWFRDQNPANTSNFTDAVSITFQ
jgi:hypothetical protein